MDDESGLRIEYVPLDKATELLWRENPKLHDMQTLVESIEKHGFRDAPAFDAALQEGGAIVDGNGRIEALGWMHDQGREPPRGVRLDDGEAWHVPIQFGVDADSEAAARAYAIDANNLTMMGGNFSPFDVAAMYEWDGYVALLAKGAGENVFPASVDGESFDLLSRAVIDYDELWQGMPEFEQEDAFDAVNSIKVHFATEKAITEFAELIRQTVTKNTIYIWYPKREHEDLKAYVAHES